MPIAFDINIFFPKVHKTDYIKLSETKIIHYQISSDNQNNKWSIAVTLEDNGKQIPKPAFSIIRNSYGEIQNFITTLPKIIEQQTAELTFANQMQKDFNNIIKRLEIEIDMLKEFKNKYNI